tara:strand:- start:2153 stop:2410 length:258 start_codon:yes stop_codon:yes gene_type:complete
MEDSMQKIDAILERNKRVEFDKAWEVSFTRRLVIVVITYAVAVVWLLLIDETIPLLKAVVPVAGYILSTLSLPFIKKSWIKKRES